MRIASVLVLATLVALAPPQVAHAGLATTSSGGNLAGFARHAGLYLHAGSIPAWARRYSVNCSHCHAPAVPRLNATGIKFRWAGYRMPEDIGTAANVEKVQNYLAIRGRMRYDYAKTSGNPANNSSFSFHDATIFYAGPFGKNFGGFFEIEREAENEIGVQAHVESAWGTEKSYGGFRAGLMHWLSRDGVAGFDRPTGIRTPTAIGGNLTSAIPFTFANDQLGVEAYYVYGRNRVSVEVLNGINPAGKGDEGDPDNKKDFVVTDQLLFDEAGSGLTAVGYFGTLLGADPAESAAGVTSHFSRFAISANKFFKDFEAQGGVVFGQDKDLPVVTGGAFATPTVKGNGYWLYAGYTLPRKAAAESGTPPTLFGRYEFVDPNTKVAANGKRRYVLGVVVPVSLPEYLRFALEYALDVPQGSGPKKHGITVEMMLNF